MPLTRSTEDGKVLQVSIRKRTTGWTDIRGYLTRLQENPVGVTPPALLVVPDVTANSVHKLASRRESRAGSTAIARFWRKEMLMRALLAGLISSPWKGVTDARCPRLP
jgi:hypothetical protein